ncbi:unnamed protein product [Arctogadus glacialis]
MLKKQVQEWTFFNPSPTPSRPTPPHLRYWTSTGGRTLWRRSGVRRALGGGHEFRPKGPRIQLVVVNEDLQHNGASTRL